MDSPEKTAIIAAEIDRLYRAAKRLKDEWSSNGRVNVHDLSACEGSTGKLNRALFSGR